MVTLIVLWILPPTLAVVGVIALLLRGSLSKKLKRESELKLKLHQQQTGTSPTTTVVPPPTDPKSDPNKRSWGKWFNEVPKWVYIAAGVIVLLIVVSLIYNNLNQQPSPPTAPPPAAQSQPPAPTAPVAGQPQPAPAQSTTTVPGQPSAGKEVIDWLPAPEAEQIALGSLLFAALLLLVGTAFKSPKIKALGWSIALIVALLYGVTHWAELPQAVETLWPKIKPYFTVTGLAPELYQVPLFFILLFIIWYVFAGEKGKTLAKALGAMVVVLITVAFCQEQVAIQEAAQKQAATAPTNRVQAVQRALELCLPTSENPYPCTLVVDPTTGSTAEVALNRKRVCFDPSYPEENLPRVGFTTSYQGGNIRRHTCTEAQVRARVCLASFVAVADRFWFTPEDPQIIIPTYALLPYRSRC